MRKTNDATKAATQLMYLTSDECVFMDKECAQKHASTLADRNVKAITQREAEAALEALINLAEEEESEDVMWAEK
jgi:hypothetical protein